MPGINPNPAPIAQTVRASTMGAVFPSQPSVNIDPLKPVNIRRFAFNSSDAIEDYLEIVIDGVVRTVIALR